MMRRRSALLLLLPVLFLGCLQTGFGAATVSVTIIQRGAIESLSPSGDVTGVTEATLGAHYDFVSAQGAQLTLRDPQGGLYRVDAGETDYVAATPSPSPAATPPATSSSPASPASSSASAPQTAATASPPPAAAPDAVSDDKAKSVDAGIGEPLFTTQNFWNESALLIASRLGLGLEDKTKWETAYRRYFYDETRTGYAPASILGGSAYCIALFADSNDVPTSALIAFTNDGDYGGVVRLTSDIFRLRHPVGDPAPDADKKIADLEAKVLALEQSFEQTRQAEAETLKKNLSSLFGDPRPTSFGSSAATREDALRWDWNGVSFLLTCQENKYNLLRIIPTALADSHGRTERIPRDELGDKLAGAVEHRPNGDVVITQIPMADQGLKGYCVPATWERVLRYTGVPGDMYTLSRIGDAGFGGGEAGGAVASQLDDTLHDYGRRAEFLNMDQIDAVSLHRYIDAGIPVFWALNPAGYAPVEERYALCDRDKDWDEWKKLLAQSRLPAGNRDAPLANDGGHQVLITGYNPETREIAWSDPWGRQTRERWMTQEEARRCSLGQYYVITW